MQVSHEDGQQAFRGALIGFQAAIGGLDDRELLAPSRCYGWAVADLLVHVHLGLQEMLLGFFAATEAAPTLDAASYWSVEPPSNDADADEADRTSYVRRIASAYRRPTAQLGHLGPTLNGLVRATEQLRPGRVAFQDQVLATGDWLATWATEIAVHHLDLGAEVSVADPAPAALRLARRTTEELIDAPLPAVWDDRTAVLLGWGRLPMTEDRRAEAGELAERLPALS